MMVFDGCEMPLDGCEMALDGCEIVLGGHEIVLDGCEIVLDGCEMVLEECVGCDLYDGSCPIVVVCFCVVVCLLISSLFRSMVSIISFTSIIILSNATSGKLATKALKIAHFLLNKLGGGKAIRPGDRVSVCGHYSVCRLVMCTYVRYVQDPCVCTDVNAFNVHT